MGWTMGPSRSKFVAELQEQQVVLLLHLLMKARQQQNAKSTQDTKMVATKHVAQKPMASTNRFVQRVN